MKRLMRVWYRTDSATSADPADAAYIGTFSDPFPENPGRQIVNVDWHTSPGEVEVTYLIPADHL